MKHPNKTAAATLLVLAGLAPATLPTPAAPDAAAEQTLAEEVSGTIASVAEDGASFALDAEGRQITIQVNERTKFTLDGKDSSKERALKRGRHANVTHESQTASEVDVVSEP